MTRAGALLVLFVSVSVSAATISPASAGERPGVKLMRPDSLAGWDHGPTPPRGWTIAGGRLAGSSDATPLLSGFTAGEFRLWFSWSVEDGGVWRIHLPEAPRGEGLTLLLGEGPGGARLTDGATTLHPGAEIPPAPGGMHTAELARRGGTLAVSVDGRKLYEVALEPARRFGLELSLASGRGALAELRGAEPPGELLVEGNDLDGWWCDGNRSAWRNEDGQIVLKPGGGNYLRTEKEYGNFTLSFEYKLRRGGNSGMGIRTPRRGWPSGDGMEIQLLNAQSGRVLDEHGPAAIYGNVPPLAWADRSEDWNSVVIKADGWMISAWVNGELVQQFNTLHHPELKHRHLRGWIGPQDHGAWIRLRNLRLLEAPDGTGLDAWLAPPAPTAATRMVDRLMNTETLAQADGIGSGVASRSIAQGQAGPHVLADLTGPGAVVRVAQSSDAGRMKFFFDGEEKPRIDCAAGELWEHVPPLGRDRDPVLTYVPYATSLRIVLEGNAAADYRIDYVTFPADLPVETFTTRGATVPRGWLSPPAYRQLVAHWGVHREHDPMPRIRPEPKTIAPGATETLAHVDGAGIVRWVKLRGEPNLLAGDDLWLSATVDGRPEPALAAPARFWFPGLGGGNFYSVLLVRRNGLANMLAMPFGRGITISATNRGTMPVGPVGAELSVEPATDVNRATIVQRPRLRGVFYQASDEADTLFEGEGPGRWVGLVLAAPGAETPGIARLVVDGQDAEGWAARNLDLFLGRSDQNYRRNTSGHYDGLAWRYLLLAPVDFRQSISLKTTTRGLPERLVLFYQPIP